MRNMSCKISNKNNYLYNLVYALLSVVLFTYDVLTFPIYLLLQNPFKRIRLAKIQRATVIDKGDKYITYKTTKKPYPTHHELNKEGIDTMVKLLNYASNKHTTQRCLGTREILKEEDEMQPNGKIFKKYVMGDYKWLSFTEVDTLASKFGKGLRELGLQPTQNIAILAETQAKWMIAAHAAFKHNLCLVTIYSTLGDDAIVHAINETEIAVIITSFAMLPRYKTILPQTPLVEKIIYMEDQLHVLTPKECESYKETAKILTFDSVVELGSTSIIYEEQPNPNDIAIIMYTSGSTGVPKGVKLTHKNMIASVKAFTDSTRMYPTEVIMGYLPLAHVFELLVENGCIFMGLRIGYSSALTMVDSSSKIKRGTKGDASILQPTFMNSVPLILDRISKAIRDKVSKSGTVKTAIFNFGYNYKIKWSNRGFSTPLTNRIVFNAVKDIMGGKLRLIAAGGAPLTADTHELVKTCLCVDIIQGYGLTETTACASNQDNYDMRFGLVGPPMTTAFIRLTNWEEGHYYIWDKPNPKGEIVVGGDIVSTGYYKNEEKSKEWFFEENGTRWFKTGDIGEIEKDGSMRIIDRKKDLVKLQAGEYVSLGKIESQIITCPLVEAVCVYAEPTKSFCVALIVGNLDNLITMAATKFQLNQTFEELCNDPIITKHVLLEIRDHCKKAKLEKFEIPEKISLVKETWTPDTGLVTATFKLKRKAIEKFYKTVIEEMYA